jgi:hypothetical protein
MPKLLDDSVIGENEKFLIYGYGGTGKTFSGLTMPPPIYAVVFGGENELKTMRSPDFRNKYPEMEGQVYFDSVQEELGEMGHFVSATAFDQAGNLIDEALEQSRKGDLPEFKSLVIDSATGMRRYAMNKAMEVNYQRTADKGKAALTKLREMNIIIPGDNDYMSEMSLTMQFMDWVFNLPMHLCVTTHVWVEKKFNRSTRETEIVSRLPLFTGNNRESVPTMFDNVWYFTAATSGKTVVNQAQTVGDDDTFAKTRMGGVLPLNLRDVNFRDVIEKFKNADSKIKVRKK